MKKKLLVGLLTVAACFSLGSTSFAATTTISSSSPSISETVSPAAWDYVRDVSLNVGDSIYMSGYDFWYLVYDGSISVTQDGLFTALSPGYSVVAADMGNDNRMIYKITVH